MAGKFLDNDGLARFKENMIQEVEARMGMPLGFEYFQTNPNVRAGSLPLTGGLYSRTIYADLWAWIQSQDGYLITEAEWQAKAEANGGAVPFYSDGDGSTTFRVPALTVWVKGKNGDEAIGDYLADTFASHKHNVAVSLSEDGAHTHDRGTMNITGSVGELWNYSDRGRSDTTGAFAMRSTSRGSCSTGTGANFFAVDFDASSSWTGNTSSNGSHTHTVTLTESAQGANETRPKTIIGIYCVIAFGTVASSGSINLDDVQQAIDALPQVINYGDLRDRDSTKPTYGL